MFSYHKSFWENRWSEIIFFFLFPFLSCLSSPLLFYPFSCHLSFLQFLPSHHFSFSFLFLPLSPLLSPPSFVMFYVSNAKVEIWEQYQKSFLYLFHQVFKSLVWVNQGYVLKNMLLIKKYWRLLFTNVCFHFRTTESFPVWVHELCFFV